MKRAYYHYRMKNVPKPESERTMKHTKGPWSFDFHGINQAGTGLRIAKLSQPAYDHSSGQPKRIESFDADGYLMAASPALLDALELASAILHEALAEGQMWGQVKDNAIEAERIANEVINEARGQ